MIIPKNTVKFLNRIKNKLNNIKNKLTLTFNIKCNLNQNLFIKIINK